MTRVTASIVLSLLGFAAGCTCGPQPTGSSVERERPSATTTTTTPATPPGHPPIEPSGHDEAAPSFQETAGGLAWHAEEPLISRRPSSSMRAAEYGVRDFPDAELTVFHFGAGQGGSVDDNIARWVGQFQQPDGRPSSEVARVERATVNGVQVTRVDVSGAFGGMQGMGGTAPAREGWRMLGAIAEGPQGVVFFKLTGPAAAISAAEGAFTGLVESVHPE